MILAIEADGASYRDSGSVRDRDRLRKEHLERLGWRVHRLWSTSWFPDPQAELAKLRAAYERAVAAADAVSPEPEPPAAGSPAGDRPAAGSSAAGPPAAGPPAAAEAWPGPRSRRDRRPGRYPPKVTVIRLNPSEPSMPLSIALVLRSASASSRLCRAAVSIFCCAAM